MALPRDAKLRKRIPITRGTLKYFPEACAYVSYVSLRGNEQHNPGEPMHWARGKSTDQEDCIAKHLLEHGTMDSDQVLHSGKVAWRALALLQLELEQKAAQAGGWEDLWKQLISDATESLHAAMAECARGKAQQLAFEWMRDTGRPAPTGSK